MSQPSNLIPKNIFAKDVLFVKYKGYRGDEYYFDHVAHWLPQFPESKATRIHRFSYLTHKGFGPGYYNNTGVYHIFAKITFKKNLNMTQAAAVEKLLSLSTTKTFDTQEDFLIAVANMKSYAKQMQKQNPY